MAVIGVNLLACNLPRPTTHYTATTWAFRSLIESDLTEHDWHIMVVDNGSTCEKSQFIMQEWPKRWPGHVSNLRLQSNLGIPRGRNAGYRALRNIRTDWDYFVEVHNDHLLPSKWLHALLQVMEERPRAGLVGPALATGGGEFASPILGIDYHNGTYETMRARLARVARRTLCPGFVRAGLTHPVCKRVAMLDEIGPYPEDMPGKTNFEDIEEAYRAHVKGWQVLVTFGALVYHHYHFTRCNPQIADHPADWHRNKQYMDTKHPDWFAWNVEFSNAMGELYAATPRRVP